MRSHRCPQCQAQTTWTDNPARPFCSERCRLIDLGAWLDERYVIPGPPADLADDPAEVAEASQDAPPPGLPLRRGSA